jgi:hypothetical protein
MQISSNISSLCRLIKEPKSNFNKGLLPLIFEHRLAFRIGKFDSDYGKWRAALEIQNRMMLKQFHNCLAIFKANNIDALAFKGPVLSHALYQSPTLRQYSDLDFFIPQNQIENAIELLEQLGYQKRDYSSHFNPSFLMKFSNVIVLKHDISKVELELHWKPFSKASSLFNGLIGAVFSCAHIVAMEENNIRTLGDEQNLKYLLLHGHKHQWFRLGWLFDFNQFQKKMSESRCELLLLNSPLKFIYQASIALSKHLFDDVKVELEHPKAQKLFDNYLSVINNQSFPPAIRGSHYWTWKYTPFNGHWMNYRNIWNHFYFPSNSDYLSYLNSAPIYAFLKPFRYLWRFLIK